MEDPVVVGEDAFEGSRISDVGDLQVDAPARSVLLEVLRTPVDQVVDDPDLVPFGDQEVDQVAPDEARAPRNDHLHGGCSLKEGELYERGWPMATYRACSLPPVSWHWFVVGGPLRTL